MASVSEKLVAFAAAAEPSQLRLRDTTPAERSAAHSWVEKHESASVRSWEHVSVTIDGERVLQVTKPEGWQPEARKAPPAAASRTPKRSAKQSAPSPASAAPSICSGSTTVAVGTNVHDRLDEFAASAYERMELTGTTPADRSATHTWVEEHANATIKAWGHESATVGGERVLILTKPAGTPAPAGAGATALPAKKKKKKKKRKGPASTEGLTEDEIKRREWQKKKQKEAIERQKKGLPAAMPSKRRRANHPMRKGHNNDKRDELPDGGGGQAPSSYNPEASAGEGFMKAEAWAPSS
jgi:hypothetical protein